MAPAGPSFIHISQTCACMSSNGKNMEKKKKKKLPPCGWRASCSGCPEFGPDDRVKGLEAEPSPVWPTTQKL